jgi:hypothetical protein
MKTASTSVLDRKISETIIDFGQPLFAKLSVPTTVEETRKGLELVVTVWNAHVLAMPVWGEPAYLADLRKALCEEEMDRLLPDLTVVLDQLDRRRAEYFADDFRAVGNWDLIPDGKGGMSFQCDARRPPRLPLP